MYKIAPAIGLAMRRQGKQGGAITTRKILQLHLKKTVMKKTSNRTCNRTCNRACKAEASKAGGGAITTLGSVLELPRGLTAPITLKT